tara:strand:- start:76 stop:804 length:729 start_codon:yes stop_codon:yes gene_type:complete
MCDPVIGLGILSAGLSIMQQQAAVRAQNAQIAFENQAAQQQYDQQVLQTTANRTGEEQRKLLQEDLIAQTTDLANADYQNQIAQINLGLMQEGAAAGQQKRQANLEFLQGRGEILASGRAGNSVTNLLADYRRQKAAFDWATDRNLAFVGAQGKQEKRSAAAERAARITSQQPYLEQMFLDPLKPMMRGKVKGPGFIGFLSAGLQGATTALSAEASLGQAGYTRTDPGGGATKNWFGMYKTT